jgi:hypothetical protein
VLLAVRVVDLEPHDLVRRARLLERPCHARRATGSFAGV